VDRHGGANDDRRSETMVDLLNEWIDYESAWGRALAFFGKTLGPVPTVPVQEAAPAA
jgi:hypothetical protein